MVQPRDDSITGYQILRGPDADSLVVIEDDTESSSTTYTDETPPAGQTHTYGVKARNAAGLGPVGAATAAVPEVLIVARHESTGNTLVSKPGANRCCIDSKHCRPTFPATFSSKPCPSRRANNPFGYHLTSTQINIRTFVGGTPNPEVSMRADDGGLPGETVLYTLTTSTAITGSWNLVTFTTGDQTTLHPNTTYWLHAANTGTTRIRTSEILTVTTKTPSRTSTGKSATTVTPEQGSGTWDQQLTSAGKTRMQINGHAIQQKEIIKLGGNGTVNNGTVISVGYQEVRSGSITPTRYRGYATSFTPGGDGWYHLSSIGFNIQKDDARLIRVAIHEDNSGGPADAALYVAYMSILTLSVTPMPFLISRQPSRTTRHWRRVKRTGQSSMRSPGRASFTCIWQRTAARTLVSKAGPSATNYTISTT